MKNKATGLKEIAFELNVSVNTVSRALRDCDDISSQTKEKVRKKAIELGYLSNSTVQFLKRDNRQLIAIILNNFKNDFFVEICEKLVKKAISENFDFTLVYTPKKVNVDVVKQCISQRVDAIITLIEVDDDVFSVCKLNNIELVVINKLNSNNNDACEIATNNIMGGKIAANFLFSKKIYDNFLYIGFDNNINSEERYKGFSSELKHLYNDKEFSLMYLNANENFDDVFIYLAKNFYNIFTYNDEVAYHLLKLINKTEDFQFVKNLNLIGYDALSLHNDGFIDINSIDYDYDLICEKAINYLKLKFKDSNIKLSKKTVIDVRLHTNLH